MFSFIFSIFLKAYFLKGLGEVDSPEEKTSLILIIAKKMLYTASLFFSLKAWYNFE